MGNCSCNSDPASKEIPGIFLQNEVLPVFEDVPASLKVASEEAAALRPQELSSVSGDAFTNASFSEKQLVQPASDSSRELDEPLAIDAASCELDDTLGGATIADETAVAYDTLKLEPSLSRIQTHTSGVNSGGTPSTASEDESEDCELPDYGDAGFWKEVYTQARDRKHVPAEWLVSYEHFVAQGWRRYLRGGGILELGCGDSNFMSDAYDDGLDDITCVDIEPSVVETMRRQNAVKRPGIKYLQADACDMCSFADKSFDIIFDKSTMDALKCAGKASTSRCSSEVHRVLKDTGLYLCVSFHSPEEMTRAIECTGRANRQWHVQVLEFNSNACDGTGDWPPQSLFMYVSRKVSLRLEER